MSNIRTKFHFLIFLIVAVGSAYGYLCLSKIFEIQNLNESVRHRLVLKEKISSIMIEQNGMTDKGLSELKKVRDLTKDSYYKSLQTNLIAAHSAKNQNLIALRYQQLRDADKKWFETTEQPIEILSQDMLKYGFMALGLPFLGLFFLTLFINRSIFTPLRQLSHRMMDFLNDRYSFKFTIPDNNEIGDLQRTFNSLAQRVLNTMDELKALDRAKSDFLSIASHELRTPMTSIKGSLSLLGSGVMGHIEPTSQHLIRIAETETDRLIRLINDLLDLAKIEAKSFNLNRDWISVDQLLEKTLQGLLGLAQAAQVKLHLRTLHSPIEIFGDHDRLQQAVTNLVSNAIKFSPKGAKVTVSYDITKGEQFSIWVTDQGEGIPEEQQLHIFEKFSQATSKENPLVKGTGLGLAISKALVDEHGGTIGVHSEVGHGSSFFIALPQWKKSNLVSLHPEAKQETSPRIAA